MKKYLTLLWLVVASVAIAFADDDNDKLKYKPDSFRQLKSSQLDQSGMGSEDMSGTSFWQDERNPIADNNGYPVNALLAVVVNNLDPNELLNIQVQPANASVKRDANRIGTISNIKALFVYIPADKNGIKYSYIDIVYKGRKTRIENVGPFKTKGLYEMTLVNPAKVAISVNSNPEGANVFIDGKIVTDGSKPKTTPMTVPDISYGEHRITVDYPQKGYNKASETITVSDDNISFNYDLRPRKTITVSDSKPGTLLQIYDDNGNAGQGLLKEGRGMIVLENIPYGTYRIYCPATQFETPLLVNENSPTTVTVKATETRTITFVAMQNNRQVDARIAIDGTDWPGSQVALEYGQHRVSMTYNGAHKTRTINVGKNTTDIYRIKLPKASYRHRSWNPFDIDYGKREWGWSTSFVTKRYLFSVKDKTTGQTSTASYNTMGEEDERQFGIQTGLNWQPYFGYGQGLNTGLFWQYYFGYYDFMDAWNHEHWLYIPLQYQFRLPVGENVSFTLGAGIGCAIGIANSFSWNDDGDSGSLTLGFGDEEDYGMPNRFQLMAPFSFGFQCKAFNFELRYSYGLTDNSKMYDTHPDYDMSLKVRMFEVNLNWMF